MAANGDMKAHVRTYDRFLGLVKWGTIASALLVAFAILIIT